MNNKNLTDLRLLNQKLPRACLTTGQMAAHMGAMQAQDYYGALWSFGLPTGQTEKEVVERAGIQYWLPPYDAQSHTVSEAILLPGFDEYISKACDNRLAATQASTSNVERNTHAYMLVAGVLEFDQRSGSAFT